jgi:beta-lactam-binding protein with PASTA domain
VARVEYRDQEVVTDKPTGDSTVRVTEERVVDATPPPLPADVVPGAPTDAVEEVHRVTETERVDVLPDGSVERTLDRVDEGVARRRGPFDPVWPAMVVLLLLLVAAGAAAWWLTRDDSQAVPAVTGMQVDEAVTTLQADGFGSEIDRVPRDEPADQVVGQEPAAGTDLGDGEIVTLLVSSGAAEVRIPNAVGLKETEARDRLAQAGVAVTVVRVDGSRPAGVVLNQDPGAGTDAASGTTVTLTISRGPSVDRRPVASVTGLTLDDAVTLLQGDGFKTVIRRAPNPEDPNQVYGQEPAAGTQLATGQVVTLLVSSGPAAIAIPNAVGLQEADARDRFAQAGIGVNVVSVFADEPAGTVVAQDPPAGEKVAKDAEVTLNVSKGASTSTVPNVVGQPVNDAQQAVVDAGFKPNVNTVPSAEPEGTVVAQNPTGGTAEKGSFVRLNVSSGTP